MSIRIRKEASTDVAAIEAVTIAAFQGNRGQTTVFRYVRIRLLNCGSTGCSTGLRGRRDFPVPSAPNPLKTVVCPLLLPFVAPQQATPPRSGFVQPCGAGDAAR